jgi:hypothetical protein
MPGPMGKAIYAAWPGKDRERTWSALEVPNGCQA